MPVAVDTVCPSAFVIVVCRYAIWRESPFASAAELADATIAPITAIPSEPPTWRAEFKTAEPTPADFTAKPAPVTREAPRRADDLELRLERVLREVEQLRRELREMRPSSREARPETK